jgi:A/G-specific adenine glycosylase
MDGSPGAETGLDCIDRPSPYRRSVPEPAAVPPGAREAILAWYDQHRRTLPFRRTNDPYAVLVSEAMAQQTQAVRAGEAWVRFMTRFPDVHALAAGSPADVLREWQGLGYNRRALNLWRAARRIVEAYDGQVPGDLRRLEALPGVGPYTARAVAAIAFGMPVGAVDTNVRRVLGRIVAGDATTLGSAALQSVADAAVPPDRPADWTHALMDLGATICHARRPDCPACPAQAWCRLGRQPSAAPERPLRAPRRTGAREAAAPFVSTSRWLRGRIVDRLRHAPDGAWTVFDGPIGEHDRAAVSAALAALAREGLVELQQPPAAGDGGWWARLSTS